jgi:hypothetical protein
MSKCSSQMKRAVSMDSCIMSCTLDCVLPGCVLVTVSLRGATSHAI